MRKHVAIWLLGLLGLSLTSPAVAADGDPLAPLGREYGAEIRAILQQFCLDCHSTESSEGELDLEQFATLADVRRRAATWLKVAEMLDNGEMPPEEAEQPSDAQRKQLSGWIGRYLRAEAQATAGDPGPVVLRRLNNAQYTYTVRDLTGVDLHPVREFPADNAAGEGFTNAGGALVMSPSLLTKYLNAGKAIAQNAVLLPDGFRFSPATTRRDWTDEILRQIRRTYLRYTDASGSTEVQLQGLAWKTNGGGRLPVDKYLAATLADRDALRSGGRTIAQVAHARGLNAKYLGSLWNVLNDSDNSQVLDVVRARWRDAKPGDAPALADEIGRWQAALVRFQSVGHMKPWTVPINPLTARQEIRLALGQPSGGEVTIYLAAGTAGDDGHDDLVVWQRPRLVAPGRADLLLCDVRTSVRRLATLRQRVIAATSRALLAADEAGRAGGEVDVSALAGKHHVDADTLSAWFEYLGIKSSAELQLDCFQNRMNSVAGHAFVQGWGTAETPSLVANSSDQHVRIPGNMKPRGVAVHPSATLYAAVGWKSPLSGAIRIDGKVADVHPECGNGVSWSVEVRRGRTRQTLASGTAGAAETTIGPLESLAVRPGDLVSVVVGPKDGNHSCDLTGIEFVLTSMEDERTWNLARDVSGDVLAANPRADQFGNEDVWYFYTQPIAPSDTGPTIPGGSLLARWQSAQGADEKKNLAEELQQLLTGPPPAGEKDPDAVLHRQLTSLGGPLFASALAGAAAPAASVEGDDRPSDDTAWGLEAEMFGRRADGSAIDPESLSVRAPSLVRIRLPADLAAGAEFVTTGVLDSQAAAVGTVQLAAGTEKPAALDGLRADVPVLVGDDSPTRRRFEQAFDDFRRWFPPALCYAQIVPVDEVVTLTLFHREDEPLCRLMLNDEQRAKLDRLWAELHFVSRDALTQVDAFAQLMEYATQDSDPALFEPYREPIHDAAAAFRRALVAAERPQIDALVDFAANAYRRPLAKQEADELRGLYGKLRAEGLSHDGAFRFALARIFVAPAFLYRLEKAAGGREPTAVSDRELASRLSYFLWSSLPDERLRVAADAGRLRDSSVLAAEARRMLDDDRARRLATEFACQWLHIYEFDALDEKSESHFPRFAELRGDMYEECIRFFTDLFQQDASVLSILNADHVFVNEPLAEFYGIPAVRGGTWRRVDGAGEFGRGGILSLAATLAKHSGASRTSPTLRGNWVCEVLLGEKLPLPPKDVPQIPEDETAIQGLTVRQLVEKHTHDVRCAGCHVRVDPLGFSLEAFDAIGRRRQHDLAGRPVDAHTRLADGTDIDGAAGLRDYLLNHRRDAFLRQFCRKLLGYALGRGVQLSDEPLLESMQQQLARNEYRFSAAVEAIVRSQQFRSIRGRDAQFADAP